MRRIVSAFVVIVLCFCCSSCFLFKAGEYTVALIAFPNGEVNRSSSQGVYMAIEEYCTENNISYKCYSALERTDSSVSEQVEDAVRHGAKLLVFAGGNMESNARTAAEDYSELDILTVDFDISSENSRIHSIMFSEEQAGFLAGYAVIAEGARSIGFIAGEENSNTRKYFNGFIQGIEYASASFGVPQVPVKCWYTESYTESPYIKATAQGWYGSGTDIIAVCGELIHRSVASAANLMKCKTAGFDIDQAAHSERYITSAVKNYKTVLAQAFDAYFRRNIWPDDLAGKVKLYGIETDSIGLPTLKGSFRFVSWSVDEYENVYARVKSGTIPVSLGEVPVPEICVIEYTEKGIPEEPEESNIGESSDPNGTAEDESTEST